MKIKTEKTNKDLIAKYRTLTEHPSCIDMDLIIVLDDNDTELGFAVVTPKSNYNIQEIFMQNCISLLEYNKDDYNNLYNMYIDELSDSNYLNYIESFVKNKGVGTFLLDYLKQQYKKLWLYSSWESVDFWKKNDYKEIEEYVYIII
jgi:hypothetical protein